MQAYHVQTTVATARVHNCPLMPVDAKILAYPHVQKSGGIPLP